MEELKLNQTPVRTSRNYNINNIKLKDITIPKEIGNFENLKLKGKTSLVKKASSLENMELKYGVGIVNEPNVKLQINIIENLKEPLELDFMLNEQNRNLVENIVINASEEAQATVVLKYETDKDLQGFHNGIVKVNANKNAKIDVILINLVNGQTDNFLSIENVLEELNHKTQSMDKSSKEYFEICEILEMQTGNKKELFKCITSHLGEFSQGVLASVIANLITKV